MSWFHWIPSTQTWCLCNCSKVPLAVCSPGRLLRTAPNVGSSTFCIQAYTSKFPIYQSFQSCDPEEPSSRAGNEYKQNSHLSACGLPRCKQITQPGQTHEVPAANPNGDRTNYDSAHLPDFKMSRWRSVLSVKPCKRETAPLGLSLHLISCGGSQTG